MTDQKLNINILLVEDDSVLRSIIAENLRNCGYAVMAAADGHDAYSQWLATPDMFQVVVSDYHMPGMYGDKLRSRIYANCDENERERPVFVIMSGAWAEAVGGKNSTSGFVAKPFEIAALHGMIQNLLAERRAA